MPPQRVPGGVVSTLSEHLSSCVDCVQGFSQKTAAHTACDDCEGGKYSESAASSCQECPMEKRSQVQVRANVMTARQGNTVMSLPSCFANSGRHMDYTDIAGQQAANSALVGHCDTNRGACTTCKLLTG